MKYKLVLEELEGEFKESDKNFLQPAKLFLYKASKSIKNSS